VIKVWDITPPSRWNWTEDDWRMYNFFRKLDLDFLMTGGYILMKDSILKDSIYSDPYFSVLRVRTVILKYNRNKPSLSFVDFTNEGMEVQTHART